MIRRLITMTCLALVAVLAATPATAQICSQDTADLFSTMEAVADLGIPNQNALMVELASAMAALASGDTDGVISDLESFISKVEAQSGKKIDPAVAAELIALAQGIINGALCPCTNGWASWFAFATATPFQAFADSPAVVGILSETYFGGAGIQVDFFGVGSPSGFICGHDAYDVTPLVTLSLNQAQLDACYGVIEGYFNDLDCSYPPTGFASCGASPANAAAPRLESTPFTSGAR